MGTSNGGIAIKIDTTKIDLLKVAKDIFGNEFEKTENYCDSRNSDCAFIGKTKELLIIVNSNLCNKFFEKQTTESIQNILAYFSNPNFVFAFEEYDSGGTYSYSLIYNGVVKRQFRSITYETQIDFGELEPIELKWKNAEVTKEDLGGGEFQLIYKDPTNDELCSEQGLPQMILQELMQEKLGFISWDMHKFLIEQGHFKKISTTDLEQVKASKVSTRDSDQKPWWKLW